MRLITYSYLILSINSVSELRRTKPTLADSKLIQSVFPNFGRPNVPPLNTLGGQYYVVYGQFFCGYGPAYDVEVRLMSYVSPTIHIAIAQTRSRMDGWFRLMGTVMQRQKARIRPYLHVHTHCNSKQTSCRRRGRLKLPRKYLNNPNGCYIGKVDLSGKLPREDRDCK